MNTPFPSVRDESMAPSRSDKASLLAGTPLAVASVLGYQQLTGTTLDAISATAIGGIGATVFGYLWHVVTVVINRWLSLDPPS